MNKLEEIFEKVLNENSLSQVYNGFIHYLQCVEDLIYKHFNFLFSEQLREATEDDLRRFDEAIIAFRNEYINLKNMLNTEKDRIDAVIDGTCIINPRPANNNVDQINLHVQALLGAGNIIGEEMTSVYEDADEISRSINDLHTSLRKNPPGEVRLISMLKK